MQAELAFSLEELRKFREKNPLARIVLAGGIFDLLHAGHVKYLNFCKKQGNLLVVHVGSSNSSKKFKTKEPVIPDNQRIETLRGLRAVDLVYSDDRTHRDLQIVLALQPDVIVLSKESTSLEEIEALKKAKPGVQIVFNPRIADGISTSQIIEKIRKNSLQLKKCTDCSICLS